MEASPRRSPYSSDPASRRAKEPGRGDGGGVDATLLEKVREFFQICDIEGKGFITQMDMQRLNGELPLDAEELENVFNTLDKDGNGYLTLDEFSSGFSEFLFGRRYSVVDGTWEAGPCESNPETLYQNEWAARLAGCEDEEEKHFCMLMDSLGASNVFEDPGDMRSLWAQLRRDEPHLLSNFEEFLARVTVQIKDAYQEKTEMESALKRRAVNHDDEIQRLYEEMEQQIKTEKERLLTQDTEKFMSYSQDLEHQLTSKEQELEQLSQKQKRLESQCTDLNSEKHMTRVENVKLKQTNEVLSRDLEHTTQELQLAQQQLEMLQEQASHLQEDRDMEMYRVTETLQRERASLLKQLDLLREMNKHLRDERDMFQQNPMSSVKKTVWKQRSGSSNANKVVKSDEEEVPPHPKRRNVEGVNGFSLEEEVAGCRPPLSVSGGRLQRIISIEEDPLPSFLPQALASNHLRDWREEEEEEEEEDMELSRMDSSSTQQEEEEEEERRGGRCSLRRDAPTSPRAQPVGKETAQSQDDDGASPGPPDRLFKVVLVGESSVGKTSILRRFCDDCFHSGTAATVGIDYSVKTIIVDDSKVALQMWDTAGQERYRSITKQFFRKADGVVVIYDITSQQSFTSVRGWLTSVEEGAGDDIPIMLLGNKTDKESHREVDGGVGEKLAKDCDLIFFETSAYSGQNVMECMMHLARVLKEQEDIEKEKTVSLVMSPAPRKRPCCV